MPQPASKASAAKKPMPPALASRKDPSGAPSAAKASPRRREDPAGSSASSAASSAASSPPASPPRSKDKPSNNMKGHETEDADEGDAADDAGRGKSLSVDRSSRPHFKEGIRLAEMGKWSTLVERLALGETQLARHKDHHGMLPLHWACTEDDVPPAAVRALLAAFPEAVLTRNNAQYLPIHLAVRARVGADTLRALAAARPSSLLVETPAGKTVLALAREVQLAPDAMRVLERVEKEYVDLSADSDDDDNAQLEHAKRDYANQSRLMRESMLRPPPLADPQHSSDGDHGRRSSGPATVAFDASFGPLDMMNAGFGPSDPIAADLARASSQSFSSQSSAPMVTSLSFVGGTLVQTHQQPQSRIEEEVATPGGSLTAPQHSLSSRGAAAKDKGAAAAQPQSQPQPARAATSRGGQAADNPFAATGLLDADAHGPGVCTVCYKKFGVFRKKYQCKSCFAVLCKKHVAGKVALPSFAKKRSVCGDCYRMYRNGPVPVTLPGANTTTTNNNITTSSTVASTTSSNANRNGPARTVSSHSGGSTMASAATSHAVSGPTRLHHATSVSGRSASVASSNGHNNNNNSSSLQLQEHLGQEHGGRRTLGNSMVMATRPGRAESTHSIVGRPSTVVGPQTSMRYSTTAARSRGLSAARGRDNSSLLLPDRPHSDTAGSASFSDGDPTSASMLLRASMASMQEVAVLHQRIATLEDVNKLLLTRVADQEKQYDEAMLLLTQTMTRVAEMEMRVPNERKSYRGTGGSTTASERASELLEADIKFSFPTPFTEKFD